MHCCHSQGRFCLIARSCFFAYTHCCHSQCRLCLIACGCFFAYIHCCHSQCWFCLIACPCFHIVLHQRYSKCRLCFILRSKSLLGLVRLCRTGWRCTAPQIHRFFILLHDILHIEQCIFKCRRSLKPILRLI